MRSYLERSLLVWLTLLSLVAFYWDRFGIEGDPFVASKPYLRPIFAITMFAVGSLLPHDEILEVVRRWPRVLGGVAAQYLAMPLIAYAIAIGTATSDDLYAGMVLVGCVPGAMASNVLTLLARGNVSYSVSLTTCATLLSPAVVPITLYVVLKTRFDIEPLDILVNLLLTVVGPVLVGHITCRIWHSLSEVMKKIGPSVAHLTILWIVATVIALNRTTLTSISMTIFGALFLVNILGYLSGFVAGRLMRLETPMIKALTLEVGMQNAGLGATLASTLFPERPEIALPPAFYTFGCMITGTILARIWVGFSAQDDRSAEAAAVPQSD